MKRGFNRLSGKWARGRGKRHFCFCCLCLLCLMTMVFCGCQAEVPQGDLQAVPAEALDVGISFDGGRWENDCKYADDEVMLLAIDHDLEKNIGSMYRTVNTVAFVLYDLQAAKVKRFFPVDLETSAGSAIPDGEGLLYIRPERKGDDVRWQLVSLQSGEEKVLMTGSCGDEFLLPQLARLSDKNVILWKDTEKKCAALSRITKDGIDELACYQDDEISIDLETNGEEVGFPVFQDGELKIVIANEKGVISACKLDGKITSFSLTTDNLLCGLTDETEAGRYRLLNWDFRKEEKTTAEMSGPLYRMCGGDRDYVLCCDQHFHLSKIRAQDNTQTTIYAPETYFEKPVVFWPGSGERVLAGFLEDHLYHYFMLHLD